MIINSFHLSKIQEKIVKTIDGPILVIAGAGSGKTRIITYRIMYMIQNIGINPNNILVLTFTQKAAKEMKDRIFNMIKRSEFNNITIGTFHSVFSKILRIESNHLGYNSNYTIYDQKDSENIIKKILKEFNLNHIFNYRDVIKKISDYKNHLSFFRKKNIQNPFKKIYKTYVQRCFDSKSLDFDDILLHTNYLFFNFPKILQKYRNKFRYILVDEYQDTNLSQNKIINHLSNQHKNIFVVGDDAQSIYNFRGANISNILNFHLEYKNTKIFFLEKNYRSTNHIVQLSNNIISFNKNQISKKTWTNNENGEKIYLYNANSEKEEAQYIAKTILTIKKKKNYQYKSFAIFYRVNAQSYMIESILKEKKIPYKIHGNISLYNRKEIRSLLNYLKFINNPKDYESLYQILKKNINNQKILNIILNISKNYNIFNLIKNIDDYQEININQSTKKKIQYIFSILKNNLELKKKNAYEIIKNVIDLLLLKEYSSSNKIIKHLYYHYFQINKKDFKNKNIELSEFLQNFYFEKIDEDIINKKENIDDKVSLMTIHLSKGLEFDVVFVTGLEENLFPARSYNSSLKEIEEERRLFYVAITRAQKIVILTYSKYRYLWGWKRKNNPSRFIKEINKNFINFEGKNNSIVHSLDNFDKNKIKLKIGNKVFHKKFGIGIILSFHNYKKNQIANIKFKQSVEKKILISSNKLYPL